MARFSQAIHYIKQKTQHCCQVLKLAPPALPLSNQLMADFLAFDKLP
jgi:hypothetical protein